MELPAWLDGCVNCVKPRQGGEADEGLDDKPQQPGLSTYCEAFSRKAQVAARLWGVSAVGAAKRPGGEKTERGTDARSRRSLSQAANRQRDLLLEVGLPQITDSYTFVNGKTLGILKLALHRESRQRRAILQIPKRTVIDCHPNADGNLGEMVKDKLKTLLMIDHVNILALHEACEDSRWLYLVYDWPEGGLLLHHLTQYHEDVTEAHLASVIREVLAALAAANRFNVHHLDWSLMCLFLSYKDRFSPLKLFGAGLAGFFVPLVTTRKNSKCRKHFYVSPELITNKAMTNHRELHACDIWSVGTLLYMLFSGRPPFCSSNTEEVLDKIKHGHWTFGYEFDTASRAAKDIIQSMLHKKWETRPAADELLKHSFMQLQPGARKKAGVICQDALSKLDQFARETHCKQTLARLLADLGLQESQYSDLEEKFRQLDLDGNGVIEIPELWEVAGTLPGMDHETIEAIIATCDRNGNSTIDISEFVSAVVLKLENKDERLLVKAFDKMDMNRDARITKGEIFKVLRQYSGNLQAGDVSSFVNEMDKDADKKIDYNEFKYLFPHMKERDEEIKRRLRDIQMSRETQRRQFRELQQAVKRFTRNLRTSAGKLSLEYDKLLKPGVLSHHSINEKVAEVIDVIRSFAGRADSQDSKNDKEKKERRQGMTGLTVMSQYKTEAEGGALRRQHTAASVGSGGAAAGREGLAVAAALSGSEAEASARGAAGGEAPGGSTVLRGGPAAEVGADQRSVAELFVMRGAHTKDFTYQELEAEAMRRRRHIWLGGGEDLRDLRASIMNRRQELERDDRRRSTSKTPGRVTIGGVSSAGGGAASGDESPGSSPRSGEDSARSRGLDSDRPSARKGGTERKKTLTIEEQVAARQEMEEAEADGENVRVKPWTTNTRKLKNAQIAMEVARGPAIDRIGLLSEEDQQRQLDLISNDLLGGYRLHYGINDELSDLQKLVRCKCARAWLPPLLLLQAEMKEALDEQRVHIHERLAVYKDGIKFCLQLCERIMFSVTEFLIWQDEAFDAMWSLEESGQMPPASRRFLPHRAGEEDENARTPPNEEEEAEAPAGPEDLQATGLDATVENAKTTSAADLELQASSMAMSLRESNAIGGTSTGFLQNEHVAGSQRLDRNQVRLRKGRSDSKSNAKLRSTVKQAQHEAVASASLHLNG